MPIVDQVPNKYEEFMIDFSLWTEQVVFPDRQEAGHHSVLRQQPQGPGQSAKHCDHASVLQGEWLPESGHREDISPWHPQQQQQ